MLRCLESPLSRSPFMPSASSHLWYMNGGEAPPSASTTVTCTDTPAGTMTLKALLQKREAGHAECDPLPGPLPVRERL